jgi:hypothetical protein
VNGDGYPDLAVGAPDENGVGEDEVVIVFQGSVTVFYGGPSGATEGPSLPFSEAPQSAELGASIAGADLNGDGYNDLFVGAPSWDETQEGGAVARDVGAVYAYFGGPGGIFTAPDLRFSLDPTEPFARFGAAIARAGDVDGDGHDDLLVGAPGQGGGEGGGVLCVWIPSPGGGPAVSEENLSRIPLLVPEELSRGRLGGAVAGGGDLDGDGYADLALGAPEAEEGAVILYYGSAGIPDLRSPDRILREPGPDEGERFGGGLAALRLLPLAPSFLPLHTFPPSEPRWRRL